MALTTLANVRLMPGFTGQSPFTDAFLTPVIAGVDTAIKKWLKREIELTTYTEYHSGNGMVDIVLRQYPVWSGTTTVAAGSNGVALPAATINVASTTGFPSSGSLTIRSGTSAWSVVTYTGKTSTTFTGCAGGTGTLATDYQVSIPVVYIDSQGAWGQYPDGFAANSLMIPGVHYAVIVDDPAGGNKGASGLLRRLGSGGGGGVSGWGGFPQYSSPFYGKLAASKKISWPYGNGNIKVVYPAGYETVPADLVTAANQLVAYVAKNAPQGGLLPSSESYESYSYSLMSAPTGQTTPEIGTIRGTLVQYREVAF